MAFQRSKKGRLTQSSSLPPDAGAMLGVSPGPQERGAPVRLRIMSYNVWNFDDGPKWHGHRLSAVADVIQKAKPSLVGLQELRVRFGPFCIGPFS